MSLISDNEDRMVALLEQIAESVGEGSGGSQTTINRDTTVNRTVNQTVNTTEPSESNTATYFSTGRDPVAVTNADEWQRVEIGFRASSVNIRTSEDLLIAFRNPNDTGGAIKVRSNESPFTIGGGSAPGIGAAFVWLQKADSAANDPAVQILAYEA